MGCCNSKKSKNESTEEITKEYSWDKRKTVDLSQFTFKDLENEIVVKKPGELNGQQFVVNNCKNSKIFLLDHLAAVTIDNCVGCQIIVGPIRGSIFLRNCQDCKVMVACQQFRTRDCRRVDVFLLCTTQPIIEATSKIRFGCYQFFYPKLTSQFKESVLSMFNNNWSNIHDFSPDPDVKNWDILPENISPESVFNLNLPESEEQNKKEFQISAKSFDSIVPLTLGSRNKFSTESCFVVLFHDNDYQKVAFEIIKEMKSAEIGLSQSKEISLSDQDLKRIFNEGIEKFSKFTKSGPVIGLEFNGENCIEICLKIVNEKENEKIYVSNSIENSVKEIEQFYNFCEMQMTV